MIAMLVSMALAWGPMPFTLPVVPPDELRVGQVIIKGNVRTNDCDILDELSFRPGQRLPADLEAAMLRAELRLLMTFHKRFDLADRQRPRVSVEAAEDDSPFVDVVVTFPEKRKKKHDGR
jgi:hypothetical protein